MMTDADLLDSIKSLGGVRVRSPRGELWALFDNEFAATLEDPMAESRSPVLMARTADVATFDVRKGTRVNVTGQLYEVLRLEPDGTGMTRAVLKR